MKKNLLVGSKPDKLTIALLVAAETLTPEEVCSRWPEVSLAEVEDWCKRLEAAGNNALEGHSSTYSRLALKVALVILAFSALFGGSLWAVLLYQADVAWGMRGQMGDFWGGFLATAASLGGTALFGLAILYQLDELSSQRAQLAQTTLEMQKGRRIAREQLRLARESAVVAQILEAARLVFTAELQRVAAKEHEEEFLALEHVRRSQIFLNFLIKRGDSDPELHEQLMKLTEAGTSANEEG